MDTKHARGLVAFFLRRTNFAGIPTSKAVYVLPENKDSHTKIAHLRIHAKQIQRHGVLVFCMLYLWQWFRHGYQAMPLEKEARGEA